MRIRVFMGQVFVQEQLTPNCPGHSGPENASCATKLDRFVLDLEESQFKEKR